jgi:hypothetical protein
MQDILLNNNLNGTGLGKSKETDQEMDRQKVGPSDWNFSSLNLDT